MQLSNLVAWCNRTIRSSYYLLFGLVPLLLTPWNYELFEYNKMMAVYAIATVVAASWLTKIIATRVINIVKTPLDIPVALFILSQFISAVFSIDPHISWFGYYSRFNGGLWSVFSYTLLYYAFLSNLDAFGQTVSDEKLAKTKRFAEAPATLPALVPLIKTALVTGTAVAVYGVLERLGIDKHLWVQDVQNRVFSTLGQPNWLAAYLVALIPLAMAFAYRSRDMITSVRFIVPAALSVLFFTTLLFTKSRSGLLGFALGDILFWLFALKSAPRSKTGAHITVNRKPAVLLHAAFAVIVFFVGIGSPSLDAWVSLDGWKTRISSIRNSRDVRQATPSAAVATGPALEVGGTESGVIRKYVWQGAVNAWKSSVKTMLVGTGTETYAFAFYRFRPVGHNLTSEWDFLYNKAHNEYLNFLATTGAFGLASYLLVLSAFVLWFLRTYAVRRPDSDGYDLLPFALFAGWSSVLVTNFFGFSVVVTQLILFLFPAIVFALSPSHVRASAVRKQVPHWIIWLPFAVALFVLAKIALFWYADTLYAKGYRLIRAGLYGQAIPAIVTASALNPAEPTYHDELGSAYATLAVAAAEGKNATQASELAARAVNESTTAIATSLENVNFYKSRTKIYYTLSALDAKFNAEAVKTLLASVPLSPNDPKIFYNLAILTGRDGNADKAIEYLIRAKTLKKNYRDAYFALWVFYTELDKPKEARDILTEYLTDVDPNDKDFQERIK